MHDGPGDGAGRGEREEKERVARAARNKKTKGKSLTSFASLFSLSSTHPPQGAPDDPRFRQFLAESDALLQSFGAMLSPSQSLPTAIGPGQATNFGALDQSLIAERRFATPYLKQAWAADALWHANNAGK